MTCSRIRQSIRYGNIFLSIIITAAIVILYDTVSFAEDIPRLDEIVITAQRPQRYLEAPASSITILDRSTIEGMQASGLADILEAVGAVDITRKGLGQADISIRGSSAEGVLMLIDGVRVHDPQTGHFLMDIPFPLDSIKRIEILHGGGSSLYGSSASGGVINIVTEKSRTGGEFILNGGSFGTGSVNASYGADIGNTDIVMSIDSGRSDGYRTGSDVRYSRAALNGNSAHGNLSLQWNAGVIDKRFGAEDFYAPYPSYEEINTVTAGLNAAWTINSDTMLRVRFGGRGHGDDFSLIRDNPDYYRNTHFNRSLTLAGELLQTGERYKFIFGVESERAGITSGSLGNRADYYGAYYSELSSLIGNGVVSLSMRYDSGDGNDSVFSPGAGIRFPLGGNFTFRARADRSFRRPTYTERYYMSPSNIGDPGLLAETSLTVETGIDIDMRQVSARLTGYRRSADDVIDWVREAADAPWRSVNHGNIITNGLEVSLMVPAGDWRLQVDASRLRQEVTGQQGMQSKYALNPAEVSAGAGVHGPIYFGIQLAVFGRYEKMTVTGSRLPVDIRISKPLKNMMMRVSVENIGDERYEELPGLPAAGRWFSAALEYTL